MCECVFETQKKPKEENKTRQNKPLSPIEKQQIATKQRIPKTNHQKNNNDIQNLLVSTIYYIHIRQEIIPPSSNVRLYRIDESIMEWTRL